MTVKRFRLNEGIATFTDEINGKQYSEYNLDEIVVLLNFLHEENERLKQEVADCHTSNALFHRQNNELIRRLDEFCIDYMDIIQDDLE